MIKVEHLTKKFAAIPAVNDISFEVDKGEIVGFLGPNGAGKSTTMKILTSFLPATSGRASISCIQITPCRPALTARTRSAISCPISGVSGAPAHSTTCNEGSM